ncbi:hypothetical protein Axy19_020 [Achromobacter phage vB_AxyS_19-32_Axy19]|nr:hypothetical protein Axy19_020 [Achromobacter phage vB_AxyS_19-32_Axy19]
MRLDREDLQKYGPFKYNLYMNADVFINGEPIIDVILADTKRGYVVRETGVFNYAKDAYTTETVHGNVIIRDRETGRQWGRYWGTKID